MALHLTRLPCDAVPGWVSSKRRLRCRRVRVAAEKEDASQPPPAKNDLLDRITRAKAYKAERQNVDAVTPAMSSSFGDELERPEESDRRLTSDDFRAQFNRGSAVEDAPGFREAKEAEGEVQQEAAFSGTSKRAATFLPSNEAIEVMGPDVRPEDFTIAEEERMRRRGAEVISVDKSYRPKVSTWGMYPRPANISEAYGGGRKIDPTQPLESEDVAKQRNEEIAAALLEYKKKKGLYVEPEVEAMYTGLFEQGQEFLKTGSLLSAAEKFIDASRVVDFKTKLGGDALLKHAICLDSLGKSRSAQATYERLTKHPQTDIRKQAKRMLFGFKAMDHLKVAKMKPIGLSSDYSDYFNTLPQEWSSTHLAKKEEELEGFDENLKLAVWMSGLILLMPLALVLALAFS